MLLDFPDIRGHEATTLFILGNGFDKAHDLKTSYSDFQDWLIKEGHQDFVDTLEAIYDGRYKDLFSNEEKRPNILWHDLESALAEINAETALNYLKTTYGDIINDANALDLAEKHIQKVVSTLPQLLKEWSESIPVESIQKLYRLPDESKYLTFNYTQTLELGYKLNSEILHIHGQANSQEQVIVGCARDTDRKPGNGNIQERKYAKKINAALKKFNKDVDENIEKSLFAFDLKNIDRVIVIGHSLCDIDLPYFVEIRKEITDKAHWHFSVFYEDDNNNKNHNYDNVAYFIDQYLGRLDSISYNQHYIFNVCPTPNNAS